MQPNLITDKDCPHVKRCGAKAGQRHAWTCPRLVLELSEEAIRRYARLFVEKQPGPKDKIILRGHYKGLCARVLLPKGATVDDELASLRWLVEDILIAAKDRGL